MVPSQIKTFGELDGSEEISSSVFVSLAKQFAGNVPAESLEVMLRTVCCGTLCPSSALHVLI